MRTQAARPDPRRPPPRPGPDRDPDVAEVDADEWYPPAAARTGPALAFVDRLDAALCDYAGAVTTALAGYGLPARAHVAAGVDLAGIDLTIPALAGAVSDGCVRFSEETGWHCLPCGAHRWARLVPLTATITPAELAPAPGVVAAAVAGLARGGSWPCPAAGEPAAVDALAGPLLDGLLAALDVHHRLPPSGAREVGQAA